MTDGAVLSRRLHGLSDPGVSNITFYIYSLGCNLFFSVVNLNGITAVSNTDSRMVYL